jgi:hypothetical protein|tara:strand:+ start:147 stop:386 length:240 start_codon:yes stop_codon:yes gene_type:complete
MSDDRFSLIRNPVKLSDMPEAQANFTKINKMPGGYTVARIECSVCSRALWLMCGEWEQYECQGCHRTVQIRPEDYRRRW